MYVTGRAYDSEKVRKQGCEKEIASEEETEQEVQWPRQGTYKGLL